MYGLKTQASFDSAHFLAGYEGKCRNLHGHHWVLEAEISGDALQTAGEKRGMLIDFGDLKKALRTLADRYDHALLYEEGSLREKTLQALREEDFHMIELPCRPTAENLARLFFEALREQGMPVSRMTVYETPENGAYYEEPSAVRR